MTVQVWRIGYSDALTLAGLGFGSTLGDGRWHIGCAGPLQVIYCGSSRALCQLERRVHCNGATPKDMALLRLDIPKDSTLHNVESLGLPADWRSDQSATQTIGMDWLASGSSLGLWVPSFVQPAERNLLLNPAHPAYAGISPAVEQNPFVFDPRLFA